MNKFYTLILLTAVSFGQPNAEKKADTSKSKEVVLKPTANVTIAKPTIKADTVKVNNLSSTPTVVPVDNSKETRVVIVKDESKADYAKYLLPIFTLILGIGINRFIDWVNDRKKIIKSGERWIVELRSTEEPIKAQIKVLETFIQELKEQKWENPQLSLITAINGEVFKSLDKNELFRFIEIKYRPPFYKLPYFRKKATKQKEESEAVKTSNITQGHISILAHQYEMMQEKWADFQSGISKHSTALTADLQVMNKQMTLIHIALEQQGVNIDTDANFKPMFDLYIQYRTKLLEDTTYNPLSLEDDLFKPLIAMLVPYRTNTLFIDLGLAITSCLNDINGVKVEMEYMIVNCTTLISRYNKNMQKINPLINQIDGITKVV